METTYKRKKEPTPAQIEAKKIKQTEATYNRVIRSFKTRILNQCKAGNLRVTQLQLEHLEATPTARIAVEISREDAIACYKEILIGYKAFINPTLKAVSPNPINTKRIE